jgi:hypothetical protein
MPVLPPCPQDRLDRPGPEGLERSSEIEGLLLGRPALLGDPRVALKELERLHEHGRVRESQTVAAAEKAPHQHLRLVPTGLGTGRGHQRPRFAQEAFEGGPRGPQIRRVLASRFGLDLGIQCQLVKGAAQVLRREPGLVEGLEDAAGLQPGFGQVVVPAGLPEHGVVDLFHFDELGVDAALDGTFPEEPGAEGMDGADEALLEVAQGGLEPGSFPRPSRPPPIIRRGLEASLEGDLEPSPQLGRGLAGKGHRGHRLDGRPAGLDQGDHPVDQALGLSRPGAGLDQEGRVEVFRDPVAGRLVAGRSGPVLPTHRTSAFRRPARSSGRRRASLSFPCAARRRPSRNRRTGSRPWRSGRNSRSRSRP